MRVNNKVGKTQDLEYSDCPIDGRSYLGQRQKVTRISLPVVQGMLHLDSQEDCNSKHWVKKHQKAQVMILDTE